MGHVTTLSHSVAARPRIGRFSSFHQPGHAAVTGVKQSAGPWHATASALVILRGARRGAISTPSVLQGLDRALRSRQRRPRTLVETAQNGLPARGYPMVLTRGGSSYEASKAPK